MPKKKKNSANMKMPNYTKALLVPSGIAGLNILLIQFSAWSKVMLESLISNVFMYITLDGNFPPC
jgi:hypothetical protein